MIQLEKRALVLGIPALAIEVFQSWMEHIRHIPMSSLCNHAAWLAVVIQMETLVIGRTRYIEAACWELVIS